MSRGSSSGVKRTLFRAAAALFSLQVLEVLTGLVSQVLIASTFGVSASTDAWFVALTVLGLMSLWATAPLQQVLIPMFRHDLSRSGERVAWENASVLLANLTLVFFLLTVGGWLAAPWLVGAIAAGFDADTARVATALARLAAPAVLLVGTATFLGQVLFSYQRFVLAGSAKMISNLVFAATILLAGTRFGIEGLAVAMVVANGVQVIVVSPILWRHRRLWRPRVDFRHERMRELMGLSVPVFVSTGGIEMQRVIDRAFASLLSAGSLSALAFARLVATAPNTFLLHPLQRTVFPHFTRLIAERRLDELSGQLFHYLRLLVFLTVPTAVGMIVLSDLLVGALFQRGAFDEGAVQLTSQALCFYALGIPAAFVGKALNNTFLGLKDTRRPMIAGLTQIASKVIFAIALLPSLAHAGIALAESLSQCLRAGMLAWQLPAELAPREEVRRTLWSALRTTATAGLMALAVTALRSADPQSLSSVIRLLGLSGLGAGLYFAMSWASRQEELLWLGRNVAAMRGRES